MRTWRSLSVAVGLWLAAWGGATLSAQDVPGHAVPRAAGPQGTSGFLGAPVPAPRNDAGERAEPLGALRGEAVSAAEPVMRVLADKDAWAADLLRNPGFETMANGLAAGWGAYEGGYVLSGGAGRAGGAAVYCRNASASERRGASQTVELAQRAAVPLRVRGWSRARDVSGEPTSDYSVYVDLIYEDGTPLWAQTGNFSTGTHDWEQREVLIRPAKPVRRLTVYALFRGLSGEVWFDDFEVCELKAGVATFDMLPVEVVGVAAVRTNGEIPGPAGAGLGMTGGGRGTQGEASEATTGDGLTVRYDWQGGRVSSIALAPSTGAGPTADVELATAGAPSGFLVRDAAAGSDIYGFESGECAALGLRLEARGEKDARCIRVSGRLIDERQTDRAVTLYFALPVGAAGWRWHDDIRRSRDIGAGAEYANVTNVHTGANGTMSVYPLGCVTGPQHGLAIAMDMDMPAQWRIGYSSGAKCLYMAYDFGLTRDTDRFPGAAPFAFVVYRTDPTWGFRSAVKRLYDIFPEQFACRSKEQGIWMPFTDVSTVQGWQDFGFRYHEGIDNVVFDDSAGILSFRYTEPSTWWFGMDPAVPRTRENVMKALADAAASPDAERRRWAEAAQVSGVYDEQGQLQYLVRDAPWTNGVVFSMNPNPHIPGKSEGRKDWNDDVKEQFYGPGAQGLQDGEYLDSLEAYVTADQNFRREHFHYVTAPLTFSLGTRRPVIQKAFSQYEFTRAVAEDVHRMAKLMFANGVPAQYAFLCPWLDIMGWETDWLDDEGHWRPDADDVLSLKRTMAYQKPQLALMNTNYDRFTPDLVERYFRRCLFYGIWPSMFSHNAADNPYWQNANWYNRDRPLFKRYIPLVRSVAQAGWEPVTGATSDNAAVWVERFGPSEQGDLYFTLLNSTAEPQSAVVTIDTAMLPAAGGDAAKDLVAGEVLALSVRDGRVELAVPMAPEQVRLVSMGARPAGGR